MASDSNIGCISDKGDFSPPQNESYQEIKLTGDDENNAHLVNSKNVTIITPPYNRCSSSNRVKINNIVDYTWEPKYQFGHLVASTIKGNYFAYSLLAQRVGGVVRVMKYKTEQRILIKDFKGHLRDLAFAYTQEVILACIDEYGNLEVHEIEDDGKQLRNIILLRLDYDSDLASPSSFHLLFWCPFIPDDPNDIVVYKNDEPNSTLLAVTHNNEVEVINVRNLSNKYGPTPISTKQLMYNQKILIRNPKEVTVATFSPDGTALATGSLEGDVNFYEMKEAAFEKDEIPSCIHEWKPHDGKPISALFFLDNHKYHQPEEQFWKFALTGADYNQEIKLWSCETWDCLQTIQFTGPIEMRLFQLKAELDATGGYLLLSDLFNKSIYVLQIYQNNTDCVVNVCSIAEFPMTHSILSIAPVEAIKCRIKITDEIEPSKKNDQNGEEDDEDDSAKELSVKGIAIRCFWISTKSLQESRITYQPPVILPYQTDDSTLSLLSQDSVAYRDPLSELSVDLQDEPLVRPENETILKLQNRAPSLSDREDLLLTPNDFVSPSHGKTSLGHSPGLSKFSNPNASLTPSSVPLPPISPNEEHNLNSSISSISSLTNSTSMLNKRLSQSFGKEGLSLKSEDLLAEDEEEEPLATSEPLICRKLSQRSSGSSPSQEVADIMGPIKPNIVSDLVNIQSQTNGVLASMESASPTLVVKLSKESDILSKDFGSWPQAPDLSKEYKLISQTTEKPSFTNQALLGADNSILNMRHYQDIEPKLTKIEQALQTLIKEMNGLSNMRQQQALEIQSLQQQLNKSQDQTRYFQNLNHRLDNLEGALSNNIQKALSDQSRSDYNNMENLMSRREDLDRQWMEKHFIQASNNANSAVSIKLDKAVKNEMKTAVLPGLSKSLDGWKESLHQDLVQRFSFSESAIKENMNKLFKNKAFIDGITQNVQINVQSQIRDVLNSQLMPTFEKICHNLFTELNETFKQGTKDYLQQVERYIERHNEQAFNSINHQLQGQSTQLNKTKDSVIQTIHHEMTSFTSSIMESLLLRIRPAIAEEVRLALKEHSSCISQSISADNGGFLSRTMTPIPNTIDHHKLQQLILQYLRSGHYNSAFQEALNAVDLDLVMFVCENVSPTKVFGQVPCPLKQPVILSLIHQLGTNLNDKIDLKISYLEEALMTLDPTDPLTHNHLPTVIGKLRSSLTTFLQLNPATSHLSKIKMIIMATNSLSVNNS